MQIDRNNYEACLLDYMEGTLDGKGRGALALFFRQNPDLRVDLDGYESAHLMPDNNLVYEEKQLLKKLEVRRFGSIHQENYEEWIIAFLEGYLSPDGQNEFDGFVKLNPIVQQEIAAFKSTFLVPDQSVIYQAKEGLKKKVPFYYRAVILWPSAVAAMLIMLFGILMLLKNESQVSIENNILITENIKDVPGDVLGSDTNEDIIPDLVPAIEPPAQISKPVTPEKKVPLLANAGDITPALGSKDKSGFVEDRKYAGNFSIEQMEMLEFNAEIQTSASASLTISKRDEMTTAFEYLALRDALKEERESQQKEKSTFGKVFASLGNKIFGPSTDESGSLFGELSNRSKESFNEFAEAMPVFRESDKSGNTNTYFALSENLKLRISKNKNRQETENSKGIE